MGQYDLLRFVIGVIESMGLKYFVTGSQVSIFFGEPRFTNDIDIVIDLPMEKVAEFCGRFPEEDYYLSGDAAKQAVQQRGQFNIIQPDSGLKIDVIIAKQSEFERATFERVVRVEPEAGFRVMFSSAEDSVVSKLVWYREGASERQLRDIAGVVKMTTGLDREYVRKWAKRFGMEDVWASILKKVDGGTGESNHG